MANLMTDHHGHHHGLGASSRPGDGTAARIVIILLLSLVYMVAEVVGGLISGSLALLADAGHMLSDVGGLALSLVALWIARRPADARRTYGYTRAEILAALAQGVALLVVAVVIVIEGVERLVQPREVSGSVMIGIAVGGLVVNLFGLWLLRRDQAHSLNIRGAWLHIAGDALGSVGVILAGLAILFLGWAWVDPAASIAISVLILFAAWHLLREVVDVLMESAPSHLDVDEIRAALAADTEVREVHDLHVWTIGSGEVSLSSHVVPLPGCDPGDLLRRMQRVLAERFAIDHATLQIEPTGDGDPDCANICEPEPGD